MKKLLSVFAIVAAVVMYSCDNKGGASQEELDKLSKEIVEKDTQIAQLEDEIEFMYEEMDLCVYERDSLIQLTTPKGTTGTKPKTTTPATDDSRGGMKDGGTKTGGRGDMKGETKATETAPKTGGRGEMKKGN